MKDSARIVTAEASFLPPAPHTAHLLNILVSFYTEILPPTPPASAQDSAPYIFLNLFVEYFILRIISANFATKTTMENNSWEEVPVQNFEHIYSDGGAVDIPFKDDRDKIFALNRIAILGHIYGVQVVIAEVIDTHLHTVIHGPKDACVKFRNELRRQMICHFIFTGRKEQLGEGFFLDSVAIGTRTSLMNHIIYVLRQVLDTGFPFLPTDYRFGPGNIFFAQPSTIGLSRSAEGVREVGRMGVREKWRILETRLPVPDDWLVTEDGLILPCCYMDYNLVNGLFRTPRCFIAFQHIKRDDEESIRQVCHRRSLEALTLNDLREKARLVCRNRFKKELSMASVPERVQVASLLVKNRMAFLSASLAKAVFLKYDDLALFLAK